MASTIATTVWPAPRKTPPSTCCTPMKPNVGAQMRRNCTPSAMTSGCPGMNAPTIWGANTNATTPASDIAPKATQVPAFATRSERSRRPAPMFCPTSVEVAIASPRAGMMTNEITRTPMP